MIAFFDTSALIKRYIVEPGSPMVDTIYDEADSIFVSVVSEIEAHSTFRRPLIEKAITSSDHLVLKEEFGLDFEFFNVVQLDGPVIESAKTLIYKYQLKTLDSIQLASALSLAGEIDAFIVCDERLIRAGKKEGLKIINPS